MWRRIVDFANKWFRVFATLTMLLQLTVIHTLSSGREDCITTCVKALRYRTHGLDMCLDQLGDAQDLLERDHSNHPDYFQCAERFPILRTGGCQKLSKSGNPY